MINKSNFLISGWICILLGSGFISIGIWVTGIVISLSGMILLLLGIIRPAEYRDLSDNQIKNWLPESEPLPRDGYGHIMYRVDTTLDPPIITSILCGNCGKIFSKRGKKPSTYTCQICNILLWKNNEDESE